MKFVWALIFAAAVSSCTAKRIVGGELTTVEEYPGIVQVDFLQTIFWGQSCAANILNNRYLLSAAHCFTGLFFNLDSRRIRAGATIRNFGGTVIRLESHFNHPSYNFLRSHDNDITVVKLRSPLTYSNTIQPVSIPPQGFEIPDNLPVVHAGWGLTRQGGTTSSTLRDVTIFTVNREVCKERYLNLRPFPGNVTDNMICAGILDVGGQDACGGDSGGPQYFSNVLTGIISWGSGCASAYYPGVSARVSAYTDWILETAV